MILSTMPKISLVKSKFLKINYSSSMSNRVDEQDY